MSRNQGGDDGESIGRPGGVERGRPPHDQRAARDDQRAAVYDAVAGNLAEIYDQKFLTSLIHDVVQTVKRNLKVDWTEPHRDAVSAEVRAAVRRVLRTREVRREHFDFLIERITEQAAALYADWPLAA